jgi:hypothetical protein
MRTPPRPSSLRELFFYIFSLVSILFCINSVNYMRIKRAVEVLPAVPHLYEPVRFILYSSADNSVSARFWFYDVSGREVASYERSWRGYALALEIQHLIAHPAYVSIPVRVKNINTFGGITSRGTVISRYFFKDKDCILLSSAMNGLLSSDIAGINFLCRFIVDNSFTNAPFFLFKDRFVKTQLLSLEGCETGVLYSVRCSQGNALIVR